jgi:hypothetical protein
MHERVVDVAGERGREVGLSACDLRCMETFHALGVCGAPPASANAVECLDVCGCRCGRDTCEGLDQFTRSGTQARVREGAGVEAEVDGYAGGSRWEPQYLCVSCAHLLRADSVAPSFFLDVRRDMRWTADATARSLDIVCQYMCPCQRTKWSDSASTIPATN